jgi:hypothetical protein
LVAQVEWAVWGIVFGVGSALVLVLSCCVFYRCCRRPAEQKRVGYGVDFRQLEALNNLQTAERLEVRTGGGILHQPQRT